MTSKRHGKHGTPEYRVWSAMISRCHNTTHKLYKHYGARGIVVCDTWRKSFEAFLSDMGERPSPAHQIDRINNDGGYEPSNCRWVTPSENSRNRRNSTAITFLGFTLTTAEWSERSGVPYQTLRKRLEAGWDTSDALLTPVAGPEHRTALAKSIGLGRDKPDTHPVDESIAA